MKKYFVLLLLLMGIVNVFSEVIILKNKEIIRGKIIQSDEIKMIVKTSYGEVTIEKDKVDKIYINEEDYEKEFKENSSKNKVVDPENNKESRKLSKDQMLNNLFYFKQKKLIPMGIGFMTSGLLVNTISLTSLVPLLRLSANPITISFIVALSGSGLFLQSIGIVALVNGCISYANYLKNKDTEFEYSETTDSFQTFFKIGTGFLIPGAILTSIGIGFGIPIFIMPIFIPGIANDAYTVGVSWMAAILSIGVIFDIVSIVCYGISIYHSSKWKSANSISYDFGFRNDKIFAELVIKI